MTPSVFEPVKTYVVRCPELKDAHGYTTGQPHFEGDTWLVKRFGERLAHAGDAFLENCF